MRQRLGEIAQEYGEDTGQTITEDYQNLEEVLMSVG